MEGNLQGQQQRGRAGELTGRGSDCNWASPRLRGPGHRLRTLADAHPHPGAARDWGAGSPCTEPPWSLHADPRPPKASSAVAHEAPLARTSASTVHRLEESGIRDLGCNLESPAGIQAAIESVAETDGALHIHAPGKGGFFPNLPRADSSGEVHSLAPGSWCPPRPAPSSLGQFLQVPMKERVAQPGPWWRLRNRLSQTQTYFLFELSGPRPSPLLAWASAEDAGSAGPGGCSTQDGSLGVCAPLAHLVNKKWKIRGLEQVNGTF